MKKQLEALSCLFDKNFSSHLLRTTWLPLLAPLEYSWTNSEAQVVEPVRDKNCIEGDEVIVFMQITDYFEHGYENIDTWR